MKKKILHVLLLLSLILTISVPFTGIIIHKLASLIFLILCLVHTVVERKGMDKKKYLLLVLVLIDFISGIMGMILSELPWVLALHRVLSVIGACFLAVHLFVYHKKSGIFSI
ncbi:MAG: heme transporter CcmB [Dorea sp.]|nr:heme transporter CcmB [Dorea sp.]